MTAHTRRAVLATLTSVSLAGCTTFGDSEPPSEDEPPDQCPTSLDLGVEWPRNINPGLIRGFVTQYEAVREFIITYEGEYLAEKSAEKPYDPNYDTRVDQSPTRVSDGLQMTVASRGSAANRRMFAFPVDSDGIPKYDSKSDIITEPLSDRSNYIPVSQVSDPELREFLRSAPGDEYVSRTEYVSRIEEYADLIRSFPQNISLNDRYRPGAYFDVGGTPVLLAVEAQAGSVSHLEITAKYYITENIIRRTEKEDKSPQDGTLVECRLPE